MRPELVADPIHTGTMLAHVLAGFLGMVGALVPLLSHKGGREHRSWGRIALWAMGIASITAFPLAAWRADPLQAAIGALAGYACIVTLRALGRSRRNSWSRAVDAALAAIAGAIGVLTVALSIPAGGAEARTGLILGAILLLLAVREALAFGRRGQEPQRSIVDHALASVSVICVGWGSFLNTQLLRLTGISLPLDVRLTLPLVVAVPVLAFLMPRWARGVAAQGISHFRRAEGDSEVIRLRRLAMAEGVSFLFLLLIAVPVKRLLDEPGLVRLAGPIHGTLTLLYFASVFLSRHSLRWKARDVALALLAGVVPLGTFFIHRRITASPSAWKGSETVSVGEPENATGSL